MRKNINNIKEITQLANKLVSGQVVEKQEVEKVSKKLDTILAHMKVFPRYFRRIP